MNAATTAAKTYRCATLVWDGRCPDGCCGMVMVQITSPKTGKVVECPAWVVQGAEGLPRTVNRKSARGFARFTGDQLRSAIEHGFVE